MFRFTLLKLQNSKIYKDESIREKMNLKDRLKNIGKYIGLGIVGGLALLNITIAQDNYKKPSTEITQEGDNIIIPENKFNEFMKNYKQEKKNTLTKPTADYIKDGYITSALTTEPLEGIEAKLITYNPFPTDTLGPALTNSQGYYTFTITGIEDIVKIENIGEIKYQIINTPTIELNLNKLSKVQIKIYDMLGKEIKTLLNEETKQKTINTDINNLASGVYIIQTTIDGKPYANKILKTDNKYNYGKNRQEVTQKTTKNNLEKITDELLIGREFKDPNNQYHNYKHGEVEPYAEEKKQDFTLIPRITLENPITDPEYTVIPNINTIRDLKWYARRVQGEWDNKGDAPMLWPIKLYIDSSNAPTGWIPEIRNVIQYYQDSLNIHPDSLIKENPTYTEPNFNNGYSAVDIIYTDSTVLGEQLTALGMIYSSRNNTFIGGHIYINTPKINNKEDAGMIIARGIQQYTTQTIDRIKDQRYLGNTSYNNLGTTKRPNNDEKKWIKTSRNSKKPYYINRIYP